MANLRRVADAKYEALVTPPSQSVYYYGVALGISIAAWYVGQAARGKPFFGKSGAIDLLICVAVFAGLMRANKRLSASRKMSTYRASYFLVNAAFRSLRIYDFICAPDRAAFVAHAAEVIAKHGWMTTHCCLAMGWLIGMCQVPSSWPLGRRVLWVLAALAVPQLPASLAFCWTGDGSWLVEGLRSAGIPCGIGYLFELVQRYFIKALLLRNAETEAALGMLSLPAAAAAAAAAEGDACAGPAAAAAWSGANEEQPVSQSDFEVVGFLGFGSSGQVRLVRNLRRGGELQALKTIPKVRDGKALTARHVAMAHEELHILHLGHGHPFIVTLMDAFEDAHGYHWALEYAANGSLSNWIRPPTGLQEVAARKVAAEVVLALEHLHDLGIIYRDLKAENVLVRSSGHVVLADFGISKKLVVSEASADDHGLLEATTIVGTPGYMAPELIAGLASRSENSFKPLSAYTFQVDWWGLGVLLHVMLTCDEPFGVRTILDLIALPVEHQAAATTKLLSAERLSPVGFDIVSRLLVLDPAQRLGAQSRSAVEVKSHAFFSTVSWDALLAGHTEPPLPQVAARGQPRDSTRMAKADTKATPHAVPRPSRSPYRRMASHGGL